MRTPRIWISTIDWRFDGLSRAVEAGGGVVTALEDAQGIVWARHDIDAISSLLHETIEWVQLLSAGIEDWLKAGVIDRERTWTAAKGAYSQPIAEYCLAMILAARQQYAARIRGRPARPQRLSGAIITVVGAGGVGARLIELLSGFGVRTIAVTRTGRVVQGATASLSAHDVDRALIVSDIIVLATPDTVETAGLLSRCRLQKLKRGAIIVNVGRGNVLDTDALSAAVQARRVGGAFLDVTEPEPLPAQHALWNLESVVVTSHTANTPRLGASAFEAYVRENVLRFASGRPLLGTILPEHGY